MNPLVIDGLSVKISVRKHCLILKSELQDITIDPKFCNFDLIIVQSIGGYISFGAMEWLSKKNISLLRTMYGKPSVLYPYDFHSHARIRLEQFRAYENMEKRLFIARSILEAKTGRDFSRYRTLRDMLMKEARLDSEKWIQYNNEHFAPNGFNFITRHSSKNFKNYSANCEVNALMNYAFKILETVVRRSIITSGLEPSIGFLHTIKDSHDALVYDLQEPFRTVCEKAVIEILPETKPKEFYRSAVDYSFILHDTVRDRLLAKLKEKFEEKVIFNNPKWTVEGLIFYAAMNLTQYLLGKARLNIPKILE